MLLPESHQTPAANPLPRSRPKPRVKVWFEVNESYSFGFGLIAILQAVARTGSIKRAASELAQSYRHIWGRIKEAEQHLGTVLVVTHVGGQAVQRSELSSAACRLIDDFLAIRNRMVEVMECEYAVVGALPQVSEAETGSDAGGQRSLSAQGIGREDLG